MRNKWMAGLACLLTVVTLWTSGTPVSAGTAVTEVQALADGILRYQLDKAGAADTQAWIGGGLTAAAGRTAEWYVLALAQSGDYDFSAYQTALKTYLDSNSVYAASSRQKYALILAAIGSRDPYIAATMEDSIGKQGIMSWIYGLHLLNNGYKSTIATADSAADTLLGLQLSDGGWALTGTVGDVDITAMAVQALAPRYGRDAAATAAIDRAVQLLSDLQRAEGDYAARGVPNPESGAQVLTALCALGIDPLKDSRFIKNGNTILDGMVLYRLEDGSFCHQAGGAANDAATAQVLYSLVAYRRFRDGKEGLYSLDHCVLPTPEAATTTKGSGTAAPSATTTTATTTTTTTVTGSTPSQSTTGADASTTTAGTTPTSAPSSPSSGTAASPTGGGTGGYRWWATLGIVIAAGIVWGVLYLLKKANRKNRLAILLLAVLAAILVWVTDFQSTDSYYGGNTSKETPIGTVTLTIRCDTVAGEGAHIPADGVILDTTAFLIEEGDTVYDILVEAARAHRIQLDNTGGEGMAYIRGIQQLYEMDFGDLSGWLFFVNGEEPSVGCDAYTLSDGDTIQWLYTCQMGKDLT